MESPFFIAIASLVLTTETHYLQGIYGSADGFGAKIAVDLPFKAQPVLVGGDGAW